MYSAADAAAHQGRRRYRLSRVWCCPGNRSEQELIGQVKDDLRSWKLSRVVWVADRGFQSAENRRYLQRCGGHYIIAEKLRGESQAAAAALARPGRRYRTVTGNLQVREVVLDDGMMRDCFVICHNPEQAERDKHIRVELITQLEAHRGQRQAHARRALRAARARDDQARARPVSADHPWSGCSGSTAAQSAPRRISTASTSSQLTRRLAAGRPSSSVSDTTPAPPTA